MIKKIILFIALSSLFSGTWADSFSSSKRLMADVYRGHEATFYCGCAYTSKTPNLASCGYIPRKQPERANRIEWEHVVPAYDLGRSRQCWQNGGRRNCRSNDPVFKQAEADMHNLVPSIGEANGDRSNMRYGMVEGEPRIYSQCDFEVDWDTRRVEPRPSVRGDIARITFYMRDKYGLALGRQQTQLMNAWATEDPVDAWEVERDRRIADIQGNHNPYVIGGQTPVPEVEPSSDDPQPTTGSRVRQFTTGCRQGRRAL